MSRARSAAAIALALATGCGGGGGSKSGQDAVRSDVTLDFQISGDPEDAAVYEGAAAAFEQKTGITIRIVPTGGSRDLLAKLTSGFAARRPTDSFLINHRYAGGFIRSGLLEPVGEHLDDLGLRDEDYTPVAADAFRNEDGTLACLPINAASLVVYMNLDRFEQAGVTPPDGPWTFEEFIDAARRLNGGERAPGERRDEFGVASEPSVIRIAPWIWSAGGDIVDDPDNPTAIDLSSPATREGLERFLELRKYGPTLEELKASGSEPRFIAGEVGMLFSSRRDVPQFRTITGFDWDVAPFPTLATSSSVLHSDGICVPKGDDQDEALRWAGFLAGPEGQRLLAEGGRIVPSHEAVAGTDAFLDPTQKPASGEVYVNALASMRRLPTSPKWPQIEEDMERVFTQLYDGKLSIDEALERIAEETAGGL